MNQKQDSQNEQEFVLLYNPEATSNFITALGSQLADIDQLIKKSKQMLLSHDCEYYKKKPSSIVYPKVIEKSAYESREKNNEYRINQTQNNLEMTEGASSINFNISYTVSLSEDTEPKLQLSQEKNNKRNQKSPNNKYTPKNQYPKKNLQEMNSTATENRSISMFRHEEKEESIPHFNSTQKEKEKSDLEQNNFNSSFSRNSDFMGTLNLSQDKSIRIQDQNTCAKNQLQNILSIQRPSRQIEKLDQLLIHNHCKQLSPLQSPSNSSPDQKFKFKSPTSKSPAKSPKNANNFVSKVRKNDREPHRLEASRSPGKNVKYIDKYLKKINHNKNQYQIIHQFKQDDAKSLISFSPKNNSHWNSQIKTSKPSEKDFIKMNISKYSHPSKKDRSPQNVELKTHLNYPKKTSQYPREQFIKAMKDQCYVKRFLTDKELNGIYLQFCHRDVPRFKWEQKVIEKIFNKIHQATDII